MSRQVEIMIEDDRRLLIEPLELKPGRLLVTAVPQYKDYAGKWHLSHSGLLLTPDVARKLAPALVAVADAIEAGEGE